MTSPLRGLLTTGTGQACAILASFWAFWALTHWLQVRGCGGWADPVREGLYAYIYGGGGAEGCSSSTQHKTYL